MIRGQIEQVGKGASGTDTNQNQPDPERAPAGSKPSIVKLLLRIELKSWCWNLRGRARDLVGFDSCLLRLPPSRRHF